MTVTEIKKEKYFRGITANEQSALGLILTTAREFQAICRQMPQEKLENHEHAAVAGTIQAMLDKNEKESREIAKQKTDELKAEIQKLLTLSEERLKSGPDWNREFTKRLFAAPCTTYVLSRLSLGMRIKLPRGLEPHSHPQTESSGVVGVDPPHLRCSSRRVPLLEGLGPRGRRGCTGPRGACRESGLVVCRSSPPDHGTRRRGSTPVDRPNRACRWLSSHSRLVLR